MTVAIHNETRPNAIGTQCHITVRWDKLIPHMLEYIITTDAPNDWEHIRRGFGNKRDALRSARHFVDTLAQ